MSFYNSHTNYLQFNSSLETHNQSIAASGSELSRTPRPSNQMDIQYSELQPTAQEFRPLSDATGFTSSGAIKKVPQNEKNQYKNTGKSRRNCYGSGRTFIGSKRECSNGNEGFYKNQQNTLQDTSVDMSNQKPSTQSVSLNSGNYDSCEFPSERKNLNQKPVYYGRSQDTPSKQYGNRNKYKENRNVAHPTSFDDTRYYENSSGNFKTGGKAYGKPYKTGIQNRHEKSNHYEKYVNRNSTYDKYGDKYNRSSMFSDNLGGGLSSNTDYFDKNSDYSVERNTGQFENGKFKVQRNDYSVNEFQTGFKPHVNKSSQYVDGKTKRDWKSTASFKHSKNSAAKYKKKMDAASQRERLEEMIKNRLLECLVCCEKIRHTDRVWSCTQCYHILHLLCVAAWAKSSKMENGWRCPACQNLCSEVPKCYKCYCGKTVDPKYEPGIIPHGCGEICLRKGRICEHKCTILCHPGPCPDCDVMVARSCGCGATQQTVKCCTDIELVCNSICNKTLNCGIHKCKSTCHPGNCNPCTETIIQECYCGKQGRKVTCSVEFSGKTQYICEDTCGKTLSCGNHKCEKTCHEGPCEPCARDVNLVDTCPCGKTPLEKIRNSCLDPIPCCDKICGRVLKCGQPSLPHKCREKCHEGECPKCPLTTVVRCRCGHMDKELPCQKLTTKADDARCEKKCTKKRTCGKHKCNQRCCIEIEHFCPLPCNHQLSCGQHRCERTCHSGRCPPCMETSFEELYCECGASVLFPPVPCGTKPPACSKPCSRQRPCGHNVNHMCHTGPCPPCTVLCKRSCYGNHEQRSAIPCHQESFSCGLPCGKPMPCGRHKCNKPCHEGKCPLPCKQPCNIERALCGHPCGRPCHDPPCPESSCKQNVPVTCLCGLQKSTRPCLEVSEEFRNIEMAKLKDKIGDISKDQTVDISDICKAKKPTVLKILECTEECRVLERNIRLAIGLQIRNPDLTQKLTPKYTDFMRQWAKRDPHFCQKVHDKLTELVQLAKQSKQKSRSYSFESMNRDKRHFIHEYCEHFGVESAAYDTEPNRNIVATAIKDKSWLPSMSLLEVIQRENGQRKVPGPSVLGKNTASKPEIVSLRLPSQIQRPNKNCGEFADYFDPPP
ncbi:hypothetical protein NQ315_004793 [Exocentrus adspersus]|uniref:Protein shuttle craft n=1 Tax=Exocentrus adspersus TaxID=1586481 RepID=A0AAV8W2X0_9CUCU|nr:hypothetical protein NQ315_004793 [Exocentrus adspersus]